MRSIIPAKTVKTTVERIAKNHNLNQMEMSALMGYSWDVVSRWKKNGIKNKDHASRYEELVNLSMSGEGLRPVKEEPVDAVFEDRPQLVFNNMEDPFKDYYERQAEYKTRLLTLAERIVSLMEVS